MSDRKKKRAAAGFAVFLLFMWICTLISKSIYAYRLPMVTVVKPQAKHIEHIVEADGMIVQEGNRAVNVPQGIRLERLFVKTGDVVAAGDILFTADVSDLEEICRELEREAAITEQQIQVLMKNMTLEEQRRALLQARALEDYYSALAGEDSANRKAEQDCYSAAESLKHYKEKKVSGLDGQESVWEGQKETLEKSLKETEYQREETKRTQSSNVRNAARSVQDSLLPGEEDGTLFVSRLTLAGQKEKLAGYRELLGNEGAVTAEQDGTITDVFVSVGGRTPDTAALLMADRESRLEFRALVGAEELKYIQTGGAVTLELSGAGKSDAVLSRLEESRSQAGSYEAVVILEEGRGRSGMTGTIKCTALGDLQHCCIPAEAVHEVNGRSFVYLLREREGVLGTEYYAQELNIRILDRNGEWISASGEALPEDSLVIDSSTKEFDKGDVVRYASDIAENES